MLFCIYGSYAHDCGNSSRCSLFAKVPVPILRFPVPKRVKERVYKIKIIRPVCS